MNKPSRVYDIGLIVGSNRRESINRKLANAMVAIAPDHLSFRTIGIDELPMYNADLEGERPASVRDFTSQVRSAEGLLFVTPEHNRSIPAVLKNAIDWGSKPMDANVWSNKAVAISGTSPGAIATAAGQLHLRQILAVLGAQLLGGEAYVQFKPELLDADGELAIDSTRTFLAAYLRRFGDLVRRLAP